LLEINGYEVFRVDTLRLDHPQIGWTLEEYAFLLRETNRNSEAELMLARAKEIHARNIEGQSSHRTIHFDDLRNGAKP